MEELDTQHTEALQQMLQIKEEIQRELNATKIALTSRNQENDDHQKCISTLKNEVENLKEFEKISLENLEEKNFLKTQVSDLKELLLKKENDIKELVDNLKIAEEKLESRSEKKLSESSSGNEEFIVLQEEDTPKVPETNEELEAFKLENHDLKVSMSELRENIQSLESQMSENIQLLKTVELEKLSIQKQLEEMNEKKSSDTDKIVDLQSEITILENNLSAVQTAHKEEIESIRKENEKLNLQLNEINDNASQVESNLMMENIGLQRKSDDVHDNLRMYFKNYANITFSDSVEEAFKKLSEKLSVIENMKKNLSDMSLEIASLQESELEWKNYKDNLEADIGHYETECAELMKNNEILLNELDNYRKNKLETIPENDEENIIVLESQLEECANLNRTLEEEYKDLNEKVSELSIEKLDVQEQLDSIKVENTEFANTIADLKLHIEVLEAEKCNLVFELNEMKTDDHKSVNENLETTVLTLNRDHEELVKKLQACERTLEEKALESENLKKELARKELEDHEVDELRKSEFINQEKMSELDKTIKSLTFEKGELLKTLQAKHSENTQYYVEIQRLGQLLQKAEGSQNSNAICENTQRLENIIKEASIESEQLKDQLKFLREKSEMLQNDILKEQRSKKLLQQEIVEITAQKAAIEKDLDRLREHLVEIEENNTTEALELQTMLNESNAKVAAMESEISKSSNAFTSASIRANQHAETLQAQYTLVTQQRDELAVKLSAAEDRESKKQAALVNLQCALEQFQNDKESDIKSATHIIRREIDKEQEKQRELSDEIAALNQQLNDANQGLLAASRISDQLETVHITNANLKEELETLRRTRNQLEEKLKTTENTQSDKVEKNLVKSLIINYIVSHGANDKNQILKLISTILDFSENEFDKVGLNKPIGGGWFSSLVPVVPGNQTKDNLMQAFVNFLEQESQPRQENLPNLLPGNQTSTARRISSTSGPVQPILVNDNVLESFAPSRNSSSILKDILSDS
ncbi:TRIP11 family protein [Megaselia abdita]